MAAEPVTRRNATTWKEINEVISLEESLQRACFGLYAQVPSVPAC